MVVRLDEMTIFKNVTCEAIDDGTNEIEGIGRGCGAGFSDDTVRVFEKGLSSSNVTIRRKGGSGHKANCGH